MLDLEPNFASSTLRPTGYAVMSAGGSVPSRRRFEVSRASRTFRSRLRGRARLSRRPARPASSVSVLLSAANLRFGYRPARARRHVTTCPLIAGLSRDIAAGDVVGILGPNGSGKTTLLRLLSGALAPASGSVTFDGRRSVALPRRALAQQVAVVPQETHARVRLHGARDRADGTLSASRRVRSRRAGGSGRGDAALEATGTAAFAERPFRTLSGGEKQRVVIASALRSSTRRRRTGCGSS